MMIPPESEEWHGVCHEPLNSSTLFKILEVQEVSQRKSVQGLDNTPADGTATSLEKLHNHNHDDPAGK